MTVVSAECLKRKTLVFRSSIAVDAAKWLIAVSSASAGIGAMGSTMLNAARMVHDD